MRALLVLFALVGVVQQHIEGVLADDRFGNVNLEDRLDKVSDIQAFLGTWASDAEKIDELGKQFREALPFPHVVIPNFFEESIANRIETKFPKPVGNQSHEWETQGWHVYDNPIEGKLAHDNLEAMAEHDAVFRYMWKVLQSEALIMLLHNITGIDGLENDPHLHGAGLHYHPAGSRLEMHLDYSIHPITKKERRVNLIVYMNKGWKEEWGGHLSLWEGTLERMEKEATRIVPRFNTAALFRTSDISWHGMPDPVACPPHEARKSVAIYYVSEARKEATHRYKASYQARPGVMSAIDEEKYEQLCKLRMSRRLNHEDVRQQFPDWNPRWKKIDEL